ncbi:MAG: hypothetical protein Q4A72_07800 [Bacillota bacterium]|nr:hypothetical protein [Bacillota bacterium]
MIEKKNFARRAGGSERLKGRAKEAGKCPDYQKNNILLHNFQQNYTSNFKRFRIKNE